MEKKKKKKYWGLIIDFYLMFLILVVKTNFDYYKIIKKKYKNFSYKKDKFNEYYFINSGEFVDYISGNNKFLGYIRDKIITVKYRENLKKNKIKSLVLNNISEQNLYLIFLKKIFHYIIILYIKIINPVVLINCYFGKVNSFKLYVKSFGKILNISKDYFFKYDSRYINKNYRDRKKLMSDFKIVDRFDEIIKEIMLESLPSSFIESYKDLREKNNCFFDIKKIGSAVNLYMNDEFKILAAEIIDRKGKLISYKHGGISEKEIINPVEMMNRLYASKTYEWNNYKGLGENYLSRFKIFNSEKFKNNSQILFFCSNVSFNERYAPVIKFSNHPRLSVLYDFFDKINPKLKKHCTIRLFPKKNSQQLENIWTKRYGKKIKISKDRKEISIYNSKIIILDDFSTPIYEFLKIGVPFIIIRKDSYQNLKSNFINQLIKMEKIGLIYKSANSGSSFLNNNYENLTDWWNKITNNKDFRQFKKNLFSSNANFLENIKKELIHDL